MNPVTKHVFISGFMGTGKSKVGRLAAKELGLPFLDTDSIIEKTIGKTITKIFKDEGEEFFREQEVELIRKTRSFRPHLISLGGGSVLNMINREVLRAHIWINLNASVATIVNRLQSEPNKRPLLKSKNFIEDINNLLKKRQSYYLLAPYQIYTDTYHPDAIAAQIKKIVRNHPDF